MKIHFLASPHNSLDAHFWRLLIEKNEQRLTHERRKPLASYREEELAKMRVNFFGADRAYHQARRAFLQRESARKRKASADPSAGREHGHSQVREKASINDRNEWA